MSEPTKFPIKVDDVVRLAARQVQEGEDLDVAVRTIVDSAYDMLSEDEQKKLVMDGLFTIVQEEMIAFISSHREEFIKHIVAAYPSGADHFPALIENTDIGSFFEAFVERGIRP